MNNKDMPAYPVPNELIDSNEWAPGFTKLEAFTMAVLQGLCANSACDLTAERMAKLSVAMAETALAELEKRNG